MRPTPPTPSLDEAPEELLASGHLWLREFVAGPRMRFRMASSGLLVFGDRERVFDEVPPRYQHAARHVRARFDRDAFRDAVSDPEAYVFYGVAPCHVGVDYDWARLPSFLGRTVWADDRERLLPVDRGEQIFRRLGLDPVNAFRKEVNVRDFHPDRYEFPDSAWYDGPAAGVLVENRRGGSAVLRNRAVEDRPDPDPIRGDAGTVAGELVTDARLDRAVEAAAEATVDDVAARVFEMVVREAYAGLDAGGTDWAALRSAVGSVVGSRLARDGAGE